MNAEVLSGDFATGLDLLADVLLNPTFPADALEREREVQIAGIQAQKDDLLKSASIAMRRTLFGDAGYGLDSLGTEETVDQIAGRRPEIISSETRRAEQLRACHLRRRESERMSKPRSRKLLQVGKQARTLAESRRSSFRPETRQSASKKPATKNRRCSSSAFAATTMHDDDRYALELLQEACSDLGSRLFLRVREKLGLAYYVGAQNFLGLAPGYFAFYAGTEPAKAGLVETGIAARKPNCCATKV